jgi:hypothetical protein
MTDILDPFPYFPEAGTGGYIYVGSAGLDARTNPITVYRDVAQTLPWAQPIRTVNGYPAYQGAKAGIYSAASTVSITVLDDNSRVVTNGNNVVISASSADFTFLQAGTGAVTRTAQNKMRDIVHVKDFGATGDGTTDDTAALQAAHNASLYVQYGGPSENYKITSPVALRSGARIYGSGAKVFRADQFNHLFTLIDIDDVEISGLRMSHSFAGGFVDRSNKSCVYGLRSSNVRVHHCVFEDTGLFAVSSDISGAGWSVCDNRFYRIGATAVDLRGYVPNFGMGFQVCRNYINFTGDDAIAVAFFSASGVIADNVIFSPGQFVTYDNVGGTLTQAGGGGIRINDRQTICNNQIYNANIFFICGANYSLDRTARPNQALIYGNVGKGIKPTVNNTTAAILAKSVVSFFIGANDFDVVGDNALTIASIADNGAGKVRITTTTAHGYYANNAIRFESGAGVGAVGNVATLVSTTAFDLTTNWDASYSAATRCLNSIHAIRLYSDNKIVSTVADNGSGQVRVTTSSAHGYSTGENIRLADAGGITNGAGDCTVISTTEFDITSLAYSGTYTSGGVVYRTDDACKWVKLRDTTFRNVENLFAFRNAAVQILDAEGLEVVNYTRATDPLNAAQITEFKFNNNTLRNPRTITSTVTLDGALFYGASATAMAVGKVECRDNEIITGAFGSINTPIAVGNATLTYAEFLNNKMAGATTQFAGIGNCPYLLLDGDWSERQHAAGAATILSGTNSITVAHGLPRNPRISSFSVLKSNGGVGVGGGGLEVWAIGGTNFTIKTDTNVTGNLSVAWRINPMPRPYINGTTGA